METLEEKEKKELLWQSRARFRVRRLLSDSEVGNWRINKKKYQR